MRQALRPEEIEQIRADRLQPRLSHPHQLHLKAIRRGLEEAFATLELPEGPGLDLYCGTQPYRDIFGGIPVWGVDRDRHFRAADIVADVPLPFRDRTFAVVLCSQALYLREDDADVVAEVKRVVAPGGAALITVPYIWRRERGLHERRYERQDLERLFSGWNQVVVRGIDGLGTGLAYHAGGMLGAIERRVPGVAPAVRVLSAIVNVSGKAIDWVTRPAARRWPALFIVVARREEE
jgi:SAM-dependent methyltransferase